MLDYSCARQKMEPIPTIEFTWRHRGLSIGNGLVFYLMHIIIGVGWILAPAYAIIAANLSLYKGKTT